MKLEGPLEPYQRLFDDLVAVAERDQRIRALWLSGSLAREVADVGSDLDLIIAVADADFEAYAANWRTWLESITTPLIARELPGMPGSFTSTNRDCLRLDVVAERVAELPASAFRRRIVVFDRDGLDARIPPLDPDPAGPDLDRLAFLAEEAYRLIAIFPQAVVGRGDWLLGVSGVGLQRQLLYDLFVEANQPLPPMGVKQWSAKLTPEQRHVLGALPGMTADRDSVVAAMRTTVDAWNTAGKATLERLGVPWPSDLADTATAYFHRETTSPS
ncbi:MAG TPA: hypothetical protein VI076_16795 [Actinopolymorphaceae bacterium]